MPPNPDAVHRGNAHNAKTTRAQAIISFTCGIARRLADAIEEAALTKSLTDELWEHIRWIGKQNHHIHALRGNTDLDSEGAKLWNLCTKLRHSDDQLQRDSPERQILLLCGRVFAFQILDLSSWSSKSNYASVLRLLNLSLRTGISCLRGDNVELLKIALGRAAVYNGHVQHLSDSQALTQDEVEECNQLKAEWNIQRMMLAWKEGQIQVAEHMFHEIEPLRPSLKPPAAERCADQTFEIGTDLLSGRDFPMAVKWLQRSYDVLNDQELDKMSRDGIEMRLAIAEALVKALLGIQTTDAHDRAWNLVQYIESEMGDHLVVLLLRLEILNHAPAETFDADTYADVLRRMIRSFNHQEPNFKSLMGNIRKLHDKSPSVGVRLLDEFLLTLVGEEQNDSWVENLVINRIWMITSQTDSDSTIDEARTLLKKLPKPLSVEATIAAQTLIWKKVECDYNQCQYGMAEKWCRLTLIPLFQNSGRNNIAKIERKILLCAAQSNDLDLAKSVFFSMSERTQNEPMTRYLMYKFAVRNGDRDLASECLEVVIKAADNKDFLYACVFDSQHCGDDVTVIKALKTLAEKHDYSTTSPVHLPALLRCMIRLLCRRLAIEGDDASQGNIVQEICAIFQAVTSAIRRDPRDAMDRKLFDTKELEWFCQNSYNLGLKHADAWGLRHVVTILTCSLDIISMFPGDLPSQVVMDLSLKSIFCNFIISSALVVLARTSDDVEEQLQDYLIMRRHVATFDTELEKQLQVLDEVSTEDLLSKLSALLVFDFEGAVHLKQWEDLGQIVRKAGMCKCLESFQAMGDCLLRAQPPVEALYSTMRSIINEVSSLPGFDNVKLARYTRCLFQVVLPFSDKLAKQLMDETCDIVRDAVKNDLEWPSDELEWMATKAQNHAVDLFFADQKDECLLWLEKGINLAQYCSDEGVLVGILQKKHSEVRLGM